MAISIIVCCKQHPLYKGIKPPKSCWCVYNTKWSANFRNEFGNDAILSGNDDLHIEGISHEFKNGR